MELRTYEFTGSDPTFGPIGIAHVVPEPGGLRLLAAATAALAIARRGRRSS